jgi:RimJ/RimL family protein N-acetyltransferase
VTDAAARLDLVPLRPEDADEMVDVLADPALYAFIGGEPPGLEGLRARYERQVVGRSADGTETWRNWIVRLRPGGEAIGYVQATITGAGKGRTADIAWVIGVPWQGRGYATEAARALVAALAADGVHTLSAHVHPDHAASSAVARAARLEPTDEIEDGERVWRRTGDGDRLG